MTDAGVRPSAPGGGRPILLLVGAAGAGKGTQAEILSRKLGLPHLASGDLFRKALRQGTDLGERARPYIERGDLVPDEVTIGMIMDELAQPSAAAGVILDGFPRTVTQAEALDATLAAQGEAVDRLFYLEVPIEELVERLSARYVCPTCGTSYHAIFDPPRAPGICDNDGTPLEQRDDDRPEVVRARLAKQVPPMLDVIDHYERASRAVRVDGRGSIADVTSGVLGALAEGA